MRQERTVQASIFDLFAGHGIGRELKAMSAWLDDHRDLLGLVAADRRRHGVKATGRHGLPAERRRRRRAQLVRGHGDSGLHGASRAQRHGYVLDGGKRDGPHDEAS